MARKPPVWLKPGDVVEVEIDGLGTLRNSVVRIERGTGERNACLAGHRRSRCDRSRVAASLGASFRARSAACSASAVLWSALHARAR